MASNLDLGCGSSWTPDHCRGSWLDIFAPGLFPVSSQSCQLYNPEDCECTQEDYLLGVCTYEEYLTADCYWRKDYHVNRGLCSEKTKRLLTTDQQNCIHLLYRQKLSIISTVDSLLKSLHGKSTEIWMK